MDFNASIGYNRVNKSPSGSPRPGRYITIIFQLAQIAFGGQDGYPEWNQQSGDFASNTSVTHQSNRTATQFMLPEKFPSFFRPN